MPQYLFTICTGHQSAQTKRAAELYDDAAALTYALELARELMRGKERPDISWLVKISDERRSMVFAIPLFAACA